MSTEIVVNPPEVPSGGNENCTHNEKEPKITICPDENS